MRRYLSRRLATVTVVTACAGAALVAAGTLHGQTTQGGAEQSRVTPTPSVQAAGQVPTFRGGINVIEVDVTVVNDRGRPVTDLLAPEFHVRIDGEQRRVVSAELTRVDGEKARETLPDISGDFYTSNATPDNGRLVVVALDQNNIDPGSLAPNITAAARFVDRLQPTDQVSFVAFPEPGPRIGFTTNKRLVKAAMQSTMLGHGRNPVDSEYQIGSMEALRIDGGDRTTLRKVRIRECGLVEPYDNEPVAQSTKFQDPITVRACIARVEIYASLIAARNRETTKSSLRELKALLEDLAVMDGAKSLVLLAGGLATDDESEFAILADLAARARVSINVLMVDRNWMPDVTQRTAPAPGTSAEDGQLSRGGLERLAAASRGTLYRVSGTGDSILGRIASELSAYYLLAVEQLPQDLKGDMHRIDVSVGRRNVTVRARSGFSAKALAAPPPKPGAESLRTALQSPFPATGLPLRVTTFTKQDGGGDKVRLVINAQIGAPGAAAGRFALGYWLLDGQGQLVEHFAEMMPLARPEGGSVHAPLEFRTSLVVAPGAYTLKFGVVDADGRRGSVTHAATAWQMANLPFAMGDLFVGSEPPAGRGIQPSLEPYVTTGNLATYLELYSNVATTWEKVSATFEIADSQNAAARVSQQAPLVAGQRETWRLAGTVIPMKTLPAGHYVARVVIKTPTKTLGMLYRPFVLDRPR